MESPQPQCLGFIMDGNRRWATERGLPTYEGHRRGGEVLQTCIEWVRERNLPHAVFYAFSTENWNRSDEEVSYLMHLFREQIQQIHERLHTYQVQVRCVGRREDFAPDIAEQFTKLEADSQQYVGAPTIWLALSYGGRAEIVAAVNEAVKRGEAVTEASFAALLWTADMPDPDMIVRTSGEQRLSNFMTWRSVYSELHFIEKHWPALTKTDFDDILTEYGTRERRRGA